MPRFSRRSLSNLSECHPDLQTLFHEVIRTRDCSVIEGERSQAEQETAVAQRRSKARWPTSMHNVDGIRRRTSWAADVVPYPLDWSDRLAFVDLARFVLETARRLKAEGRMQYDVRWGGDWDRDGAWEDERFFDGPHFELLGVRHGE